MRLFIALSFLLPVTAFADTYIGIVQGLSGESYYQRHFDEQVEKLVAASGKLTGKGNIQVFQGAEYGRNDIINWLDDRLGDGKEDDQLILYLVGHGSYDSRDYRFNIPGPDLTGGDLLAALTQGSNLSSIVLVNTSSSSGALLELFANEPLDETHSEVMLVTATKNGRERTATRFGRHFADALGSEAADLDKSQAVSLQEAFDFAVRETEEFYKSEGLLATEHAQLQGENAGLLRLANLIDRPSSEQNPQLASLYQQRDMLDRQIDSLRLRRIGMTDEDYLSQFQNLMLELAILQGQIDQVEGRQ